MPSYTLADLMSQATTRAGRRADIKKSDVSFWVNTAYEEVAAIADRMLSEQTERYSLSSGSQYVPVPSGFESPIALSLYTLDSGSGKTLTEISPHRFDESNAFPVGEPQRYVFFNENVYLHPAANSFYSLELRYRSYVTDLLAETDVPSMTTAWRKAILYLTEAEVWAFVDNPTQEAIARQRYYNYVSQLESDRARRQQDKSGLRVNPVYPEVRAVSKRSFDVV